MPKFTFERGNFFQFAGGAGVVIADGIAVLVNGSSLLTGLTVKRESIPADAMPVNKLSMRGAVRLALETALIATA